ncbi:sulfatase-like hydrolase/transferase [Halosimplex sp. J119]
MTSIALIVFDALRKDSFDEHFEWLPGVRFDNAWSTSGWTVPAHGSLFAGGYPSETGVYAKTQSLSTPEPVLAERLSEAGYTTRGFSANANISDAFDFTRGFDEFHHSWRGQRRDEDVVDWGSFISRTQDDGVIRYFKGLRKCLQPGTDTVKSLRLGVQMKARDLGIESIAGSDDGAAKVLDLIEGTNFGDEEFFFANLMEAHTPYKPPEEYQTVDVDENPSFQDSIGEGPDEQPALIRQSYDDCVRYLSDIYEDIFEELTENFDYVITMADHGEMFGRDGIWEHNRSIYPELSNVPLCVWRGDDEFLTREEPVSIVDVYETVLALAGESGESARGSDLLGDFEPSGHLVERHGLRASRIENLRESGYSEAEIERYDANKYGFVFPNGTYGWETDNGILTTGEVSTETVEEHIGETLETIEHADVELGEADDISGDVQDRLEYLGYA